ncbi:hypothetical protein [Cupriavidus basilensis]|uniref:hypothetical protein n=1 Tax=Cupriavidus basilensis TaxID=68895 RepID=UPI0023E78BC4|nr:hypothetical protein [Cupriavidus basilensis]MDF3885765.1 hypothetical protein [Cupriavidus basilensis]
MPLPTPMAGVVLSGAGAWQGAVFVLAMLAGMASSEWHEGPEWLEWPGRSRASHPR